MYLMKALTTVRIPRALVAVLNIRLSYATLPAKNTQLMSSKFFELLILPFL